MKIIVSELVKQLESLQEDADISVSIGENQYTWDVALSNEELIILVPNATE